MHQEIAREPSSGNSQLQVSRVPFSNLSNQTKLFLDYQRDPLSLQRFYPNVAASPARIDPYVNTVISNYRVDRGRLCDALHVYNKSINAGELSLINIGSLREPDTVAVVTGQQAGLFTGPLYTIYKVLSAIKMAQSLNERNVKAVPVFWIASEDHDFEEVSETSMINGAGVLQKVKYLPGDYVEDTPVGRVEIDNNIQVVIEGFIGGLPQTVFTEDIRRMLMLTWSSGTVFSSAFARHLAGILSSFGMIFIDPLYPGIKSLSAPIYQHAVVKASEIVEAVTARSRDLIAEGYHAQVEVKDDYFPLFWHDDAGKRRSLRKVGEGAYRIKGENWEFGTAELTQIARTEPERFSPGVMLRPVVQDYLLPTLCYFGGGAEIAYFAQNSEVYRILDRPATPIFHRQSFSVIESKHRRTLEKYNLQLTDLFDGLENVMLKAAAGAMSADSVQVFDAIDEDINLLLHKLEQRLSIIDPTLAESLEKRRPKILHHIAALRKKTLLSEMRQHDTASRQIESLFAAILPDGQLQERELNLISFTDRFGPNFIGWLYKSIDLEDKEHRIVYL